MKMKKRALFSILFYFIGLRNDKTQTNPLSHVGFFLSFFVYIVPVHFKIGESHNNVIDVAVSSIGLSSSYLILYSISVAFEGAWTEL